MIAPVCYVFGIPANIISTDYTLEEILPMIKAANEFVNNRLFFGSVKTEKKPQLDEFRQIFGKYKRGD